MGQDSGGHNEVQKIDPLVWTFTCCTFLAICEEGSVREGLPYPNERETVCTCSPPGYDLKYVFIQFSFKQLRPQQIIPPRLPNSNRQSYLDYGHIVIANNKPGHSQKALT